MTCSIFTDDFCGANVTLVCCACEQVHSVGRAEPLDEAGSHGSADTLARTQGHVPACGRASVKTVSLIGAGSVIAFDSGFESF